MGEKVMASSENKKKVLIVSFLFPPLSGIGAVRIAKFAKYLPQFGWEPIVLTVNIDKKQPQTLPLEINGTRIIRTPYFRFGEVIGHQLDKHKIASPLIIPEAPVWSKTLYKIIHPLRVMYELPLLNMPLTEPIGWYFYAVRKGLNILNKGNIDIIFSSFSPAMPHFIASRLHRKTGVPWVAEFRDPWALNPYTKKTQPFQFMQERLEKWVMKGSGQLITVSEPVAKELETLHCKEIMVIPNGFDETDYAENVPLTSRFTITYTGNIYPGKRDPTPLFEATKELRDEGKISPDNFEVRFFGGSSLNFLCPLIKNYRLENMVKLYNPIPLKESIKMQQESTVLLLLAWNDPRGEGTYTGKVFEYLGAGRPVLAIAYKGGVINKLLNKSGCGIVANRVDEIRSTLIKWLEEFREYGEITSYYHPDKKVIMSYSRKEQTKKLARIFDEVTNSSRSPHKVSIRQARHQ